MPKRSRGLFLVWRKDREIWHIRWYEGGRKYEKTTGSTIRKQAESALAEFLVEKEPVGPRDPSQFLISDILNIYATEKAIHAADPARIGYAIDALLPFWGEQTVSAVKEATCRAYQRQRGVSPNTVRRELSSLGAAINYCTREGYLTSSVYVWMSKQGKSKDRWLTRGEAARLLRAALYPEKHDGSGSSTLRRQRLHLPLFILIGLYTGARKEAILSLRWSKVDLQKGLIDFSRSPKEEVEDETHEEETNKGRPIIPIPRRLMTFLRTARERGSDTGYVIMFNGKPVKDVKKAFKKAALQAGFDDVSPHTLRHTAASWMVQKGIPFPEVARYLGHRDSRTTERIYAHHAPDYLKAARDSFN